MSLHAMRVRLPLWAFILLAVICFILLGIACACASDHPAQKIERAVSAISGAPALVEIWTFALGALTVLASLVVRRRGGDKRSSPAVLQRFLF
jgi:hypothetical protein